MSLFNSRTDTEKEIEEIRKRNKKHVNNESQNRNFGFGTQNTNRYGRAITTYKSTNKDKVDNLPLSIDTNKKSNAQNNKVSTDNKKDTLNPPFLDIKTIIWIIISVALSVVFYEQNYNLALLFFGQLLFGLGFVLYSNRTTKPAVIKLLLAVLKLIGASMLFSATVFLMNGRSSSILKEAPLMSLFFGVFWAVALWGLVVNLTKVIISIVRCTEKVTAKVISYKVHRNTEQGDVYSEIYKYSFNDKIYTMYDCI